MAIDTTQKRYSLVGLFLPTPRLLPTADGTFDQGDLQHFEFLYSGIEAAQAEVGDSVVVTVGLTGSFSTDVALSGDFSTDCSLTGDWNTSISLTGNTA